MYIMWYFVFGALLLLIPAVVLFIVSMRKMSYYDKERDKVSYEIEKYLYGVNREKEKELRETRSILSAKFRKWDKFSNVPFIIGIVLIGMVIIFTSVSVLLPLKARFEVQNFESTYEMYEMVSEGQSDIENIALSETANEYNKWLRDARLSKKRFGAFSKYYNQDVENLKYIGEKYE